MVKHNPMKKLLTTTPAWRRAAEQKVQLLDEGAPARRERAEPVAVLGAELDGASLHLLDATR